MKKVFCLFVLMAAAVVGRAKEVLVPNLTDETAHLSPQRFYRAQPLVPPTNMVLKPPAHS